MRHACTMTFRALVVSLGAGICAVSSAQTSGDGDPRGGVQLEPFYRTDLIYDDNLFFSNDMNRLPAEYLASSLGLRANVVSRRTSFLTGASMTSEFYFGELESITELVARTEISAGVAHSLSDRNTISANASYLSTLRPGELIPDTGLELARIPGRGAIGTLNFSRTVSRRSTFDAQYNVDWIALERVDGPDADTLTQTISAGWTWRFSPRNTYGVHYSAQIYDGQNFAAGTRDELADSHVLFASWTRRLGRRVSIELGAGPRLTLASLSGTAGNEAEQTNASKITPDFLAAVSYSSRKSEISAKYSRSQSRTFGAAGFANTQSASISGAFSPNQRMSFGATPSIYVNESGGRQIYSYILTAGGGVKLASWLSFQAGYSFHHQDGTLSLDGVSSETRTRNQVTLSVVAGDSERFLTSK